jgi:predicted nucleic acid-binding protein
MILVDTDVISALAKVDSLPLLFTLFKRSNVSITPGVLAELTHSLAMGRQYAETVFGFIGGGRMRVIALTAAETTLRDTLPDTLGAGERESIAVAKERKGTVITNESRVAHYCHQLTIPCVRLPDILRALWTEDVVSRQEVQTMIEDLQAKDRMQFKQETLDAIFAESNPTTHSS